MELYLSLLINITNTAYLFKNKTILSVPFQNVFKFNKRGFISFIIQIYGSSKFSANIITKMYLHQNNIIIVKKYSPQRGP